MPRRILRGSGHHRRCAHTLWEMLVVLLLLGTIAALVGPAMASLRPSRGDDVARATENLATLLAQARSMALRQGHAIDVVVDPATTRAWVYARGDGGTRLVGATNISGDASVELVAPGPRARFTFQPTGSASGPAIAVRDRRSVRIVTVDPWSGAIDDGAR